MFVLDLPGAYSLNALTRRRGRHARRGHRPRASEALPDLLVCVADATNLRLNLRLVLEAKRLGLPMVVALNMTDMAEEAGIAVDVARARRANSACR